MRVCKVFWKNGPMHETTEYLKIQINSLAIRIAEFSTARDEALSHRLLTNCILSGHLKELFRNKEKHTQCY